MGTGEHRRPISHLTRALALTGLTGLCSCTDGESTATDETYPRVDAAIEARVDRVLSKMTLDHKGAEMHGLQLAAIEDLYYAGGDDELGIPPFKMVDGPRGVRAGNATAFPVGMARGATWDPELEQRVGEAIALEAAAKGANVILAPVVNILRHPAWGRAQETYGEDSHLLARMGVAFTVGAQKHVLASVKHYAANSIEESRFIVDVRMDERTLREVYLDHFRRVVQEGNVGTVMCSYNRLNGLYACENAHILHDILKGEWRFDGVVESDWGLAVRSTAPSALAGLDIEMPAPIFYGAALKTSVRNGEVPESVIDDSVRRILRKKFAFRLNQPAAVQPDVVESPAHVELARVVEQKAIVLLKNERDALPLDRATVRSIVVLGGLADTANIGDKGSSNVYPSRIVTPLAGIREMASQATVVHLPGGPSTEQERTTVRNADAAIVVAGLTSFDEGEFIPGQPGGDRETLDLATDQQALIKTVASLNGKTIVVLEGGSAIVVSGWIEDVEGLLMAWYPGQEGGHAIAEVLFGEVNPSGKLPLSFPASADQLPQFDHVSESVAYGYLHGYRWLDAKGHAPQFPFGFGLSYTTFELGNLRLDEAEIPQDGELDLSVDVTNTGARSGDEIVQLYIGYEGSSVERAPKDLRGFARVHLEPDETKALLLDLKARDLAYYDTSTGAWRVEPITYQVYVGTSSRDLPLQATFRVSP